MSGEGVPQSVRRGAVRQTQTSSKTLDQRLDLPGAQGPTAIGAEESIILIERGRQQPQIVFDLFPDQGQHRHETNLGALTPDPQRGRKGCIPPLKGESF
jgi:hypothetical protein